MGLSSYGDSAKYINFFRDIVMLNEENQRYYNLIAEFNKITGVPVVLNTSFNVRGEPIVYLPEDAIRCFYSTGMDCLVIDNFVLKK